MASEVLTGEVQEKINGIWRTVWLNGFPVQDHRKADLPPYVHPGRAGATYVGTNYGVQADALRYATHHMPRFYLAQEQAKNFIRVDRIA